MAESDFIGYWKITSMEAWNIDYIDLVVPGFIEFEHHGNRLVGQFQFGTVDGWLDCRLRTLQGQSYVEWSWEGRSDNDPGSGRGWARLEDGKLRGRLFIHASDDSAFEAEKQPRRQRVRTRRR